MGLQYYLIQVDLYISNFFLAYSSAMKGNSDMARFYLSEYSKQFGDFSRNSEDFQRVQQAREISD